MMTDPEVPVTEYIMMPQIVHEIRQSLVDVMLACCRMSEACAMFHAKGPHGALTLVMGDGSTLNLSVIDLMSSRRAELQRSLERLDGLLEPEEAAAETAASDLEKN